nr:hypothetical protein [Brucella intermedia]
MAIGNLLTKFRNRVADILRVEDGHQSPALDNNVGGDIRTLNYWRDMASRLPHTIECSSIELIGNDQREPYFVGPGRIEIRSESDIRFFVYAQAPNPEAAFLKRLKAQKNPYNLTEQFQIHATDYQGVHWACGWATVHEFADAKRGYPLTGEISGLITRADSPWVAKRSSVELLLIPAVDLPMSTPLVTETRLGDEKIMRIHEAGQHQLKILGTTVKFTYEAGGKALWITAETSEELKHPYAENWLTEPLRILLGTDIRPRMVARNMGDGTAQVWLRPSEGRHKPNAIGLLHPFSLEANRSETFWQLYTDILKMVAAGENFEAHPLTHLYTELGEASEGSPWVISLTLASTVESLAEKLMTNEDRESEFSAELIRSMKKHLRSWKDDQELRERLLNNLGQVSKKSILKFMRELGTKGTVDPTHVQTWSEIRNAVMHGTMVEPWSSEEGDAKLQGLLKLVHDLTRAYIRLATSK